MCNLERSDNLYNHGIKYIMIKRSLIDSECLLLTWVIGSGIVTGIIVTRSVRRAWVIVTGTVIVTWIQVTGSAVISAVVTSVDRGQTQNSEENQYLHCVIYPI